jgi:hypothetical protein
VAILAKNALLRPATTAALRSDAKHRIVAMADLNQACVAEADKAGLLMCS